MIDISRSMLFHIGNLNTANQRISYQMGTGKNQENGSEDSLLHSSIIHIEDRLRVTQNLQLQIVKTQAANEVSDSSFAEMKDLLDKVKVDLLKGLNSGMSRSDKLALATNLKGIKENMFDLVNVRVDGEYVFSGSVTTKQTFLKDADYENNGKVTYNGDGFLRKIAVQPGSYRDRGVTGYEVGFYTASTGLEGKSFTFQEDERIIDSDGHEWKLNAAKTALQKYDHNGVIYHPPVEQTIVANTPSYDSYDAASPNYPQATKATYTINVNTGNPGTVFEAKHNYFDDINVIINALEGYATKLDGTADKINSPITDDQVNTSLRVGLEQTSWQFDYTNIGHGELGGRNNVFNIAYDKLISQETHYNILLQETSGADMAKLAMESKSLEMTYSALYSTITRMNDLSLVNFMN